MSCFEGLFIKMVMVVKAIPAVKSTKALRSALSTYAAAEISTYSSLTSDSKPRYVLLGLGNLYKESPNVSTEFQKISLKISLLFMPNSNIFFFWFLKSQI